MARIKTQRRQKKAVSSIIAAVLLLGIMFTVFVGYYYSTSQMQQIYQRAVDQRQSNIIQQGLENMLVYG
ncbi:MAG: hypothetical protein ACRECH_16585, partial [Nitrososphaerales archaeon]